MKTTTKQSTQRSTIGATLASWFDSQHINTTQAGNNDRAIDWLRITPFVLLHLVCLTTIWVGWSPVAVIVALAFYALRMFGITAFYHRYFSHKTFKTSRPAQFIFALIGAAATQRGPLWWASNHRHHHIHSDKEEDEHSPRHGFLWSHMGWFLSKRNFVTNLDRIRDFAKFPELKWLDRYDIAVPVAFAVFMFVLGAVLNTWWPELGTNGWQMLIWGYFISTVLVIHATLSINSLAHLFGRRRFKTQDDSKNSFLLALITFGEGWHNNHHRFPSSARQGLRWWEVDFSYYGIWVLEKLGIIWDVKRGPDNQAIAKAMAN